MMKCAVSVRTGSRQVKNYCRRPSRPYYQSPVKSRNAPQEALFLYGCLKQADRHKRKRTGALHLFSFVSLTPAYITHSVGAFPNFFLKECEK